MNFTADFETTTSYDDCRVWATGISSIDESYKFEYGNNIDFFINHAKEHDKSTYYFHNLKFDGEFILYWLFTNGYKFVKTKKKLKEKTFCTLISDAGLFYSIEIMFDNGCKVSVLDSLKILPFSVERVAKGFALPLSKLEIDYNEIREIGHELTREEIDYLRADVEIMSRALKVLFDQGLTKMTQGSNALFDYKRSVGGKNFEKWFPIPMYDHEIRESYKGGFTYCNPKFQGKEIKEGIVLDVNSLYPSVMYYQPLPYGEGIAFDGKYKKDKIYNLYVQMIRCNFEVKENHIPTIQIKNNRSAFIPNEYIESSDGNDVTLCLTSVDLKLFFEHYDVYNIEYLGGWKFKSTTGLFKEYIDKWNKIKMESTLNGNEAMRTLAKLMMNALYGKFALNPKVKSKEPYMNDEGVIKYSYGEEEQREPIYIPIGAFVTAWARYKTITSAQKVYDRFLYADTDSLHLIGTEIPKDLEVDKIKLGAWKHESTFTRARFLRQKSYIEEIDGKLHITCAGMPSRCHKHVTWENFQHGTSYKGRLQLKHVKGGIVLEDIDFTIKM